MELLSGDHQIKKASNFPQQISPYPPSGNLTFSLPPQKLRPIRRMGSRPLTPEEEEEFNGSVERNKDPIWTDEFCSSASDDEEDLSVVIKESTSRKRKRKRRKKLKDLLESFVLEMMEKQEQMNKQFLDIFQRRERERIVREEAWKQQEIERMKRDEEVRAQETSRNLALISFIQNLLGHSIEVEAAQPLTVITPGENNGCRIPSENDLKCDPNKRIWPEAEVQALITLRTALEKNFQDTGFKGSNTRETISSGMHDMGYNQSASVCGEQWKNMNKYFKKSLESGGKKQYEKDQEIPLF